MPTLKLLFEVPSETFFGYVELSKKVAELILSRREELEELVRQQNADLLQAGAPATPEASEAYFPDSSFQLFASRPPVRFFRPKELLALEETGIALMRTDPELQALPALAVFSAQMVIRATGVQWIFLGGESGAVAQTYELDYKVVQDVLKDPQKASLDKATLIALYEAQQNKLEQAEHGEEYEGEEVSEDFTEEAAA